jgi:hypothetical protein
MLQSRPLNGRIPELLITGIVEITIKTFIGVLSKKL